MAQVGRPEEIKELTVKQKKFLKVYFDTGNATKAALAAYDTDDPKTASVIGAENIAKLSDVVRYIMNKKGLDVEWMVDRVNEAGSATKWNDFTGEREPDHNIRLKAVDVAERWVGMKEDKDTPTTAIQNNYFNVVKGEKEEFE